MKLLNTSLLMFLSFVSYLIFLANTNVVLLRSSSFLALIMEYPITYWLSLVLCTVALYKAWERDELMNAYLLLLLLFFILVGTPFILEPYARYPSQWPTGIAKSIIQDGRAYPTSIGKGPYFYYPGHALLSAMVVLLTNLSLEFIQKSMVILIFILIMLTLFLFFRETFNGYVRNKSLNANRLIVVGLAFFIIFSWHNQIYYCPFFVSSYLIALFYYLVIKGYRSGYTQQSIRYSILLILLSVMLNITHPFSSLFMVNFMVILYFLRARVIKSSSHFGLTHVVIFISYSVYVAYSLLRGTLVELFVVLQNIDLWIRNILFGREGIVQLGVDYQITLYTRLTFLLFLLFLSMPCVLRSLSTALKTRRLDLCEIVVVVAIVATLPLLSFGLNGEILERIYIYLLPLLISAIVKFARRLGVVFFAILFVFAFIHPIAYVGDESHLFVPESTMVGFRFIAWTLNTKSAVFTHYGSILWYYDPSRAYVQPIIAPYLPLGAQTFDMKCFEYSVISVPENNLYQFHLGYNPITDVITKSVVRVNRLYDSENFILLARAD